MKLLIESTIDVKCLAEGASGKKQHFIEGVFMQSEVTNKNRRMYPQKIMEKEVSRYKKELIEQNRGYGELNHPATPQINLDRVSHMFEDLRMDGKNVWGRAKIVSTPSGQIVKTLIDAGAALGVSSRGTGTLTSDRRGISVVQEDFRLATAGDIVANPSAPDAFVNAVMEGEEWVMDHSENWHVVQTIEEMQKLGKRNSKAMKKGMDALFEEYLESL